MKTQEQLKQELYAPLPADAIKPHPTKTFLSTIKPIYVTDRLNEVFGIGKWKIHTENVVVRENGTVVNKTTLTIPDYDIYYECFGGNDNGGASSKGFDLGDAFKGATTDAINKISSFLGIGIDVYRGKVNSQPITAPKNIPSIPAPLEERKAKALGKLRLLKTIDTVPLLKKAIEAFRSGEPGGVNIVDGATITDFVEKNTIETISLFYNFVK